MNKSIKKRACLSLIIGSVAASNLLAEHMHKIINMSDRDVEVIADIPRAPDEKIMVGPGKTSMLDLEKCIRGFKARTWNMEKEKWQWRKKKIRGEDRCSKNYTLTIMENGKLKLQPMDVTSMRGTRPMRGSRPLMRRSQSRGMARTMDNMEDM